jgi:hypothetical protein
MRKKVPALLVVILAISVFGIVRYFSSRELIPVISIQANELFEAYKSNENKADELYRGKAVEITGTVRGKQSDPIGSFDKGSQLDEIISINKIMHNSGHFDETALIVGKDLAIVCFFPDGREVERISPGDIVTLKGVCQGIPSYAREKSMRCVIIFRASLSKAKR